MFSLSLFGRNQNRTRKRKLNSRRAGDVGGASGLRLEPLEERRLLALFTVTDHLDTETSGSLRWAIAQANASPGDDQIEFDLSGSNTITLASSLGELPAINQAVEFDGVSSGMNVTIDGSLLGGPHRTTGLRFEGSGSSVAHNVSNVVLDWFDTGLAITDSLGSVSNINTFDNVTVNNALEVGIHIENPFTLVKNSTVTDSRTGVLVDSVDAELDTVTVAGGTEVGIHIRAKDVTVRDSTVSGTGSDGIAFTPADANDRYTGGLVESTNISSTGRAGIYIASGVRGVEIVENTIYNTGQDGILIASPGSGRDFDAVTTALTDWLAVPENKQVFRGFNQVADAAIQLYKDGDVVYEQYFGDFSATTRIPIASASKLISSTTVMTLVDEGLIDNGASGATHKEVLQTRLDSTVATYLPEFANDEEKADITIAQTLSHMSGLPAFDRLGDTPPTEGAYGECFQDSTGTTLELCVNDIAAHAILEDAPGNRFGYGGVSMQVAGRVAEQAYQGLPDQGNSRWIDVFQDKIGNTVDMPNTRWKNSSASQPPNPRIAGGVWSSMPEYGHLLEMLLNQGVYEGAEILSSEAVELMFANNRVSFDANDFAPAPLGPNESVPEQEPSDPFRRYGLGAWLDRVDATDPDIGLQVSSPGAYGFWPWMDFEDGYYGVLMLDASAFTVRFLQGAEYVATGVVQDLVEGIHGVTGVPDQDGLQDLIRQQLANPTLDGDVDGNGVLELDDNDLDNFDTDEEIIEGNLGNFNNGGATWADGDLNGDGEVTSDDKDIFDFFILDRNVVLRDNTIYSVGTGYDLVSGAAAGTFDFDVTSLRDIDEVQDPSGGTQIRVVSPAHGLNEQDRIQITGTTDYDGVYAVTVVNDGQFLVDVGYASDQAGYWHALPSEADGGTAKVYDAGSGDVEIRTNDGHSLAVNDHVRIRSSSSDYSGTYSVASVSGDSFNVTDMFVSIQSVAWEETAFAPITGFASGSNVQVTSASHGLTNGAHVLIEDHADYRGVYVITNATINTFDIAATYNGSSTDDQGSWMRTTLSPVESMADNNGDLDITSTGHGLAVGDYISIERSDGIDGVYRVEDKSTNVFTISATLPSSHVGAWGRTPLAPITEVADGSGVVEITSVGHGLSNGNYIVIEGTTSYDGLYAVSSVDTDTFEITAAFVTSQTGVWQPAPDTLFSGTFQGEANAYYDIEFFSYPLDADATNGRDLDFAPISLGVLLENVQADGSGLITFDDFDEATLSNLDQNTLLFAIATRTDSLGMTFYESTGYSEPQHMNPLVVTTNGDNDEIGSLRYALATATPFQMLVGVDVGIDPTEKVDVDVQVVGLQRTVEATTELPSIGRSLELKGGNLVLDGSLLEQDISNSTFPIGLHVLGSDSGIEVDIRDIEIHGFTHGLLTEENSETAGSGTPVVSVEDVLFQGNMIAGRIETEDSTIRNTTALNSGEGGFVILGTGAVLDNVVVEGVGEGEPFLDVTRLFSSFPGVYAGITLLDLSNSSSATLTDVTVRSTLGMGIVVHGMSTSVTSAAVSDTGWHGIYVAVDEEQSVLVEDSEIHDVQGEGIQVLIDPVGNYGGNVVLRRNLIWDVTEGFHLDTLLTDLNAHSGMDDLGTVKITSELSGSLVAYTDLSDAETVADALLALTNGINGLFGWLPNDPPLGFGATFNSDINGFTVGVLDATATYQGPIGIDDHPSDGKMTATKLGILLNINDDQSMRVGDDLMPTIDHSFAETKTGSWTIFQSDLSNGSTDIDSMAAGQTSSETKITSASHGLAATDRIRLFATDPHYYGSHDVVSVDVNGDDFEIDVPFDVGLGNVSAKWAKLLPVTSYSAGSGVVTVASADHGLSNGETIKIVGTEKYNGLYTVSATTSGTFDIEALYDGDNVSLGEWYKAPYVEASIQFESGNPEQRYYEFDFFAYNDIYSQPTLLTNGNFPVQKLSDSSGDVSTFTYRFDSELYEGDAFYATATDRGTTNTEDLFTYGYGDNAPTPGAAFVLEEEQDLQAVVAPEFAAVRGQVLDFEFNTYDAGEIDLGFTYTIDWGDAPLTAISATADGGGGKVVVTSTAHGLSNDDEVVISGTTDYNGTFTVSNVTANTFEIVDTWTTSQSGVWSDPLGAVEVFTRAASVLSASHVYEMSSVDYDNGLGVFDNGYTIQFTITDSSGNVSSVETQVVEVFAYALQADEDDPLEDNLVFGGTPGADTITFSQVDATTIGVSITKLNGQTVSDSFNVNNVDGRIIFYAQAGADAISASSLTQTAVEFYGGAGDDTLSGGSQSDTLSGEAGADSLIAGGGADTLVGGAGNDSLDGGSGTDRVEQEADADQTLTNSSLSGLGSDTLTSIEEALLVGGDGNNTLDASAFTAGGVDLQGSLGDDTLKGGSGDDMLRGGAGEDSLLGNGGNDILIGGAGDDELDGGSGTDRVEQEADADQTLTNSSLSGLGSDTLTSIEEALLIAGDSGNLLDASAFTSGPVTLQGGLGDDTLLGGTGNDSLIGGSGSDLLGGNEGNDTLDGGSGDDSYRFNRAGTEDLGSDQIAEAGGESNDGVDELDFSGFGAAIDVDLSLSALQAVHADLDLTLSTGDSIENVTGSDAADTIAGNSLSNILDGGANNDTLTGSSGADFLIGGAGDDSLSGGADDDDLIGGEGADTLAGGSGDDTYVFVQLDGEDLGSDIITEDGSGSNDANDGLDFRDFESGISLDLSSTSLQVVHADLDLTLSHGSALEFIIGTDLNDILTGNDRNNLLVGRNGEDSLSGANGNDSLYGHAGDDSLAGGNDDDILIGGEGSDSIDGGSGSDQIEQFSNSNQTLSDTLLTGQGDDTLANIETAILRGGVGDNAINAGGFTGGAVVLDGGAGNDTLTGSAAADTLEGSWGNDLLIGNGGDDSLLGSAGDDVLLGGDGDDTLEGGAGDDVLQGGADDDSLVGDSGDDVFDFTRGTATDDLGSDTIREETGVDNDAFDILSFAGFAEAVTVNIGTTTAVSMSGDLVLTLLSTTNIEAVIGSPFSDTITGNSRDNFLVGGAGDDALSGDSGNDFLRGDTGDDSLTGGSGDDQYNFSREDGLVDLGNDTITETGGSGSGNDDFDLLDFFEFGAAVDVDLSSTSQQAVHADLSLTFSTADGLEVVIGSLFGDDITGNGRDNLLSGVDGDDTINGMGGNDILLGGDGADSLTGGADDDILISGDFGFLEEAGFEPLLDIYSEWNSANSYADRIDNLLGIGSSPLPPGSQFIPGTTVFDDDDDEDTLIGGAGLDWFLYDFFEDLAQDVDQDEEETDIGV